MKERAGVGVIGMRKQLANRRFLHNSSQIHDDHAVRDMFYNGKVVTDKHVGQVEMFSQIQKQVQNLGLD